MVIATENPSGSAGTQALPRAQLDRFAICLSVGYPDFESELCMAMGIGEDDRLARVVPVMDAGSLKNLQRDVCGVYMDDTVCRYVVELVRATRAIDFWKREGARALPSLWSGWRGRQPGWMDGITCCLRTWRSSFRQSCATG